MSTNATISVVHKNGIISSVYLHWDGDDAGKILKEHYNTLEKAEALVALGNLSVLSVSIDCPTGHSFENPEMGCTIAYHRDRREDLRINAHRSMTEFKHDTPNAYRYLFKDRQWKII